MDSCKMAQGGKVTAKEMFEAVSRGTVTQEEFATWYRGRSILCFTAGRRIERQEWEQSYRIENHAN